MADDRETIIKRLIISLTVQSDELQSIADEIEGEDVDGSPEEKLAASIVDAIASIDTAKEKLMGVVTPDEAE
jgi:hypothetical protein